MQGGEEDNRNIPPVISPSRVATGVTLPQANQNYTTEKEIVKIYVV